MKYFFIEFKRNKSAGFTLIEMLLVLSLITVLAGLSLPVYQSFQVKSQLDLSVSETVQGIRRAEILSQVSDGDSNWGIKIQNGSSTIFKGADYSSRDTAYDEVIDYPDSLTMSGLNEIVFEKVTGFPQVTGDITLSTPHQGSRNISINSKGIVEY